MKIEVDTGRMVELMTILSTANGEIDRAAEKLLAITTHNDWACKERNIINDYVLRIRQLCQSLQNDCTGFTNAARRAVESFCDAESNISKHFSSVEGMLGRILSNPVVSTVVNGWTPSVIGSPVSAIAGGIAQQVGSNSVISNIIGTSATQVGATVGWNTSYWQSHWNGINPNASSIILNITTKPVGIGTMVGPGGQMNVADFKKVALDNIGKSLT